MATPRFEMLKALVGPKLIRYGVLALAFVGGYDSISSQFDLPKLGTVAGMSGPLLPIWAWFFMGLIVLYYALFEYVRKTRIPLPEVPATPEVTERHLKAVHQKLDEVAQSGNDLWNAVESLERAVFDSRTIVAGHGENRVERTEKAVEKLQERFGGMRVELLKLAELSPNTHLDLIHLLSFAVDQATLYLLDQIIAEAPTEPIPMEGDADHRRDRFEEAESYVRRVKATFGDSFRNAKVHSVAEAAVRDASEEAEKIVREMAQTNSPSPLTFLDVQRYKIAEAQCLRIKALLERERIEVEERAAGKRGALIERMDRRSKN